MRFFIILIIVTLAALTALPSHAQVYLDGDTASIPSTQMKPGDYVRYMLQWDTTFSSVHGDDENVDSEITAGGIDIRVHLGDDAEVVTILDNGEKVWEDIIVQQPGFCWSCNKKGTVDVELILTCSGTLQVYVDNQNVYSKSGLSTATALQVYSDNDAKLVDQGTYYNCNEPVSPPDYHANTTSSSNFKFLAAAVGGIVLLGVGLALAFKG